MGVPLLRSVNVKPLLPDRGALRRVPLAVSSRDTVHTRCHERGRDVQPLWVTKQGRLLGGVGGAGAPWLPHKHSCDQHVHGKRLVGAALRSRHERLLLQPQLQEGVARSSL